MSESAPPTHVTESMSDRKKSRELAEARANGAVAPEVDVNTGSMINPHNPEFITKRPWYLGGSDQGPSLSHQADQRTEADRTELSLTSADRLLQEERYKLKQHRKEGKLRLGMWVEALKKEKKPYLICQIIKIAKNGTEYDLKFEDGTIERRVKFRPKVEGTKRNPRIRLTKMGNRSHDVDHTKVGKETYDSKRDAYHGYDATSKDHMNKMEERYKRREELRKSLQKQRKKDKSENENDDETEKNDTTRNSSDPKNKNKHSDSDSDSDYDSDDEFVQRDEDARTFTSRLARQGGVGGAQMKVTARNLRIREDTAKYLRNLDLNSAYYDPKSRSMRDNPNPEVDPEDLAYAGDNVARISGDAVKLAETQVFAWDAIRKAEDGGGGGGGGTGGMELHPQADPSQAELLKKTFQEKSEKLQLTKKRAVLDKYGGSEYLDGRDGLASAETITKDDGENESKRRQEIINERKARFGVSVTEEHYTRDGRLATKGGAAAASKPKLIPLKSKYEEDLFQNGHVTVWGSYFHRGAFRWGYADDHSLLKNSYCTGVNGRKANDEANELRYGTGVAGSVQAARAREMLKAVPVSERSTNKMGSSDANRPTSSRLYGEADQKANLDQEKLRAAIKKEQERIKATTSNSALDERKRKYNSLNTDNEVTEEDMEAYRLKRERADDPMAKLSADGKLLDYK